MDTPAIDANIGAGLFVNFTSPPPAYFPITTKYGINNSTHTSNISLGYLPETLPTPWPYLTASACLSFVLAAVACGRNYYSYLQLKRGRRDVEAHPGVISSSLFVIGVLVATIRAFSAFVAVCRRRDSKHVPMPSTLTMLLLSAFPYGCARASVWWFLPFKLLALLDSWLVWIAIILSRPFTDPSSMGKGVRKRLYTGMWLTSGNPIAVFVDNCDTVTKYGTIPSWGGYDPSHTKRNRITLAEEAIGWTALFGGLYLLIFLGLRPDWKTRQLWRTKQQKLQGDGGVLNVDSVSPEEREEFSTRCAEIMSRAEDTGRMDKEDVDFAMSLAWDNPVASRAALQLNKADLLWNLRLAFGMLGFILIFVVISISVHVTAQTQPRNLMAADVFTDFNISQGNLYWADCFEVPVPVDRLGFWDVWWQEHKTKAVSFLAVV
jgi:hypothetical protein